MDRGPAESRQARKATLQRSVQLFRAFRTEQSDPDGFYRLLADDSVRQVSAYADLAGRRVVDVGGGPGYFSDAFTSAGASYVGLDPDVGELAARGMPGERMIRASGTALPLRDGVADVCYSSNVLEHVADPVRMLEEMVRVTTPGGTVFVSFTPWLSPWGGHETSPWHVLGGDYARRRYARRTGHEPKNRYGESLFALSVATVLRWAGGRSGVEVIDVFPRYYPSWMRWVVRVPGMREAASWNVALVLRKTIG